MFQGCTAAPARWRDQNVVLPAMRSSCGYFRRRTPCADCRVEATHSRDCQLVLLGREITEDVNGAYPDYTNGHGGNDNVLKIKNVPLNADRTSKFHMLVAAPYQTGAYSFDP